MAAVSEPDVTELIDVAEAIRIIDSEPVRPGVVELALEEADGLALAEDLVADRDYPPFDRSQMDGYAVVSPGLSAGAELRRVGEVAAGQWPQTAVRAGEAVAVMTGAPMPQGADAVAPVEDVVVENDLVRVMRAPILGRYIARRGSDVRAGTTVLSKGETLGPAQLAVAATVGAGRVAVYRRPTVAVLGTGDELVGIGDEPGPAQIRNSNNLMLMSLLRRWNCDVRDLGIVRDEP